MKHILKLYLALILIVPVIASAQDAKDLKGANKEIKEYSFVEARESLLKESSKGNKSINTLKGLGDSYYFNADYNSAAKWYGQLYEVTENLDPEYIYRYALSLKSSEKYTASDNIMEAFYKAKGEDYRANLYINERNYLEEIELNSGRFELINVDFNSKLSDFAPAFYDGSIIFSSNRSQRGTTKRIHNWNKQPFLDLYKLNDSGDNESSSTRLSSNINTIYHESTAILTKDGKTLYFTRNNYTDKDFKEDKQGTNRLKLYRAIRSSNKIKSWRVEELPFNSNEYSVAHPALSPDEKTLYFSSDMPGTKGLSDIFKVAVNDSAFGEIQNLGKEINTEGRETFPFVSKDNKLYFASDGHVGLGGLDVFVSELNEDAVGEVYNLGKPVNSPNDDFTFIVNSTTGIGYFASNREGGVGDDDIYSFKSLKPLITKCEQSIDGFVLNNLDNTPISNAKVFLLDEDNTVINESLSGTDGSFSFSLECSKTYSIRSTKDTYTPAEKVFNTPNKTGLVNEKLLLKKVVIPQPVYVPTPAAIGVNLADELDLNPIYFDLSKSFIRPDAQRELQKVVDYMRRYPSVHIDVQSHTDSRSSTSFNQRLSQRRNDSTKQWIIDRGISRDRISGRGYGESQLVNGCSNGVKCTEYEHQQNRRSMFIVTQN